MLENSGVIFATNQVAEQMLDSFAPPAIQPFLSSLYQHISFKLNTGFRQTQTQNVYGKQDTILDSAPVYKIIKL